MSIPIPTPKQPKKPNKNGPRRLRTANLDKLQARLLTVLVRETENLMDLSHKEKLDKNDALSLVNYLKLIKDLKKQEEEELSSMSDEQLERLV